jgi:hypothetical protein
MPPTIPSSAEAMAGLRIAALTKYPSLLSKKFQISEPVAIGVCMEFWSSETVVSLICFVDGNASLYFSSGGGMIGGVSDSLVRQAAVKFVQFANMHMPEMSDCKDFPHPEVGNTTFYVLTPSTALVAGAPDLELADCSHPFSQLFSVAQCVITCLRRIDEKKS